MQVLYNIILPLLAVAIACERADAAAATDLFVAPNGTDCSHGGCCSKSSYPCRSLNFALKQIDLGAEGGCWRVVLMFTGETVPLFTGPDIIDELNMDGYTSNVSIAIVGVDLDNRGRTPLVRYHTIRDDLSPNSSLSLTNLAFESTLLAFSDTAGPVDITDCSFTFGSSIGDGQTPGSSLRFENTFFNESVVSLYAAFAAFHGCTFLCSSVYTHLTTVDVANSTFIGQHALGKQCPDLPIEWGSTGRYDWILLAYLPLVCRSLALSLSLSRSRSRSRSCPRSLALSLSLSLFHSLVILSHLSFLASFLARITHSHYVNYYDCIVRSCLRACWHESGYRSDSIELYKGES